MQKKSDLPTVGKISADVFSEVIYPHLGKKRNSLLVGPQNGVDAGIIDLGNGKVMALTTDPFFIVPQYGWERASWFAVHILASDLTTTGFAPQYMSIDLNLPMSITRDELEQMWKTVHRECEKLGITIATGHTGKYDGCNYPMVGGCTLMSIGDKDAYVTPAMAGVGDVVLMTKGSAIEAAGIFAVTFKEKIKDAYGSAFADEAEKIFYQMSTVDEALALASIGTRANGITAMHDATECGVYGGLFEIAQASKVGITVDKDKIILSEPIGKICDLFDMDPYISISEGTLLATCKPEKVDEAMRTLRDKKIEAEIIGEILPREKGMVLVDKGTKTELRHPRVDPFWGAFAREVGAA
jgi:hydrogenase expression/formation protein HypE